MIGLISGFLLTLILIIKQITLIIIMKIFCLVKIMHYLMNKLFYQSFLVFYQKEAIKVTKNQSEDDSIINAADYTETNNVYNPLESLNDDDAVIPIAYYKNNYTSRRIKKKT